MSTQSCWLMFSLLKLKWIRTVFRCFTHCQEFRFSVVWHIKNLVQFYSPNPFPAKGSDVFWTASRIYITFIFCDLRVTVIYIYILRLACHSYIHVYFMTCVSVIYTYVLWLACHSYTHILRLTWHSYIHLHFGTCVSVIYTYIMWLACHSKIHIFCDLRVTVVYTYILWLACHSCIHLYFVTCVSPWYDHRGWLCIQY